MSAFDPAADKQAMMRGVQARGMRCRASSDGPLGDDSTFFQINDLQVTFTFHNISHRDVQSLSRWLNGEAAGIGAVHLNTAHHFARLGIDDLDGTIRISRACNDGRIIQMRGRVVSRIVRCPPRSTTSTGQRDGFRDLVRCPAYGYNSVIAEIRQDFVGIGEIERLAGIPPELVGYMDHLAFT